MVFPLYSLEFTIKTEVLTKSTSLELIRAYFLYKESTNFSSNCIWNLFRTNFCKCFCPTHWCSCCTVKVYEFNSAVGKYPSSKNRLWSVSLDGLDQRPFIPNPTWCSYKFNFLVNNAKNMPNKGFIIDCTNPIAKSAKNMPKLSCFESIFGLCCTGHWAHSHSLDADFKLNNNRPIPRCV